MPKTKLPHEQRELILELYKKGSSIKNISEKISCAPATVSRHLKGKGVPIRKNNLDKNFTFKKNGAVRDLRDYEEFFISIYLEHMTGSPLSRIAKKYKMKTNSVKKGLRFYGFNLRAPGFSLGNNRGKEERCDNLSYLFIYRNYERRAESRGLAFNISKNDFCKIIKKDCHYCGDPPMQRPAPWGKTVVTNGVDRINNKQGYSLKNCVSCCTSCNTIKMAMPYKEFLDKVSKIYRRLAGGKAKPAK